MGRATHVPRARGCAAWRTSDWCWGQEGWSGTRTTRACCERSATTAGTPGRPPWWWGRRPAAVSVPCCAPASPARDLAARVLGEPLTAEGARVVANAPRPATSLAFTAPVGRPAPSRVAGAAPALVAALVAGPARPLRGRRHAGGQAAHGDDRRAHPRRVRRSTVAPAAAVAVRPAPARRAPGGVRPRSSRRHRTSPRRSRPRRPSRATSRRSRSTASATSTAAPTPRPTPTCWPASASTPSSSCRRCR